MDNEELQALQLWVAEVASLEPAVREGIAAYASRLAADKRLRQADREFAQAQADAIRRGLSRSRKCNKTPTKAQGKHA